MREIRKNISRKDTKMTKTNKQATAPDVESTHRLDARQIKYRGKRLDNGEWAYGYLCNSDIIGEFDPTTQLEDVYRVDPNTIGQFIGIHDKNGKEICESDILKTDEGGWIARVVFAAGAFILVDLKGGFSSEPTWKLCEIIGNTFEDFGILMGI